MSDSSISVHRGNVQGCEFVSPILKGAEGLDFVVDTINVVKAAHGSEVTTSTGQTLTGLGGKVNSSCGVHIHIELPAELPIEALQRLYFIMAQHEDAMFASTGTHGREHNDYCTSIKRGQRGERLKNFKFKGKTKSEVSCGLSAGRDALNTGPYLSGQRDAVEFRLFSGSLNPQKIAAWIQLCLALVQWAISTKKCVKWESVGENDNAHGATRGSGEKKLNRLFYAIGWTAGRCRFDGLGDLEHDKYTVKKSKTVLRKMARQYDCGFCN